MHDAWLGRGERVTVGNQTALIARVGHQLAVGGQVREHSTPGDDKIVQRKISHGKIVCLCIFSEINMDLVLFNCLKIQR